MSRNPPSLDLPVVKYEVTEHHVMQSICTCGQVHTGEFPATVTAAVQYGPRAQAAMVQLNLDHAVSVQRTAALMKDFFELPVSQATVLDGAGGRRHPAAYRAKISAKRLSIQP